MYKRLRKIKSLLLKNYPQKILAFIFSFLIWVLAIPPITNVVEVQFPIPITYFGIPKHLEIVSDRPQTTNISVEVSKRSQTEIHPSLFQAIVNLEDVKIGKYEYVLKRSDIKRPPKVKVIKISPNKINLKIEKLVQIELEIRPVFQGELAKDYSLKKVELSPTKVLLYGAESAMLGIQYIETKSINIQGLNSDLDMVVHLNLPDRTFILNEKEFLFTAKLKVGGIPAKFKFEKIPIGLINQSFVTKINPKTFNVLLKGPKNELERFSNKNIQAVIDLSKYHPGNYKLKSPTIKLPPNIQVEKVWPPIDIWVLKQKI